MEKAEQEHELGYETSDFVPSTTVLAVERKKTSQESAGAPDPRPGATAPQGRTGSGMPAEPGTG